MKSIVKYVLLAGLLALLGGCYYYPDYGYVRGDGYYGDAWYGSGYYGPSYGYGYYGYGGYAPYWYGSGYYGWNGYYPHGHGSNPGIQRSNAYPGYPRPPGYSGSHERGQPPSLGHARAPSPTFSRPASSSRPPMMRSPTPPAASRSPAPRPAPGSQRAQ